MTSFINDRGKTPTTGTVTGPASSTDNAVARFDGTGGKTLQNSAFIVDDTGHVTSFGGQITFPATQAASAGANTLDDYEEGTWTPAVAGSSTAGTQGYTSRDAVYVKVGRAVLAPYYVVMSSKDGTTAGNVRITGLPFTSDTTTNLYSAAPIAQWKFDLSAGYTSVGAYHYPNTTLIEFAEMGDNVAAQVIAAAGLLADTNISGALNYRASA